MPPLSSHNVGYDDDVLEIQHHFVHLNHPDHHHKTLVESINSLLHVGHNGSHHTPGSGIDLSFPTPEEEISEDILILLFTIVPLIGVAAVIFLIAVTVRKMRRSESLQEVPRINEFKMSTKINKGIRSTSPFESFTTNLSKKSKSKPSSLKLRDPSSSPISLHEIRVVPAPQRNNNSYKLQRTRVGTQLSLESNSSSSSSNCSQHSNSNVPSPDSLYFSQAPLWYLYSTPYYRSQYHLNKLHRQLSNNVGGSLHSLGSMQSLHQCNYSSSDNVLGSGQGQIGMNGAYSDSEGENGPQSECSEEGKKRKSSKKLKKVFQMMNIPKRIRQHQAEKNRFNIYNIPNETREQLKQIYVY